MAKRQSNVVPAREKLERAIEVAIAALDACDGDLDLEPEETDHSSSEDDFDRVEFANDANVRWDDEPSNDNEPSLGSLSCVGSTHPLASGPLGFSQTYWAVGDRRDLECEHDGAEPDADDEKWDQAPSAGVGLIAWTGEHVD